MQQISIRDAQLRLNSLIDHVLNGEEVFIGRGKKALVQLVPVDRKTQERSVGGSKGIIVSMAKNFSEPADFFMS